MAVLPRITLTRIPIHLVYPSRRHLPRRVQVVIAALTGGCGRIPTQGRDVADGGRGIEPGNAPPRG